MMTKIDLSVMVFVQEHLRTNIGNAIIKFITHLGDDGILWIALGVGLLLFRKTRKIGWCVLVSLLINLLITNVTLKNLIARPRPFHASEIIQPLICRPSSFSFPSGHTSGSLTAALAFQKYVPKKYGVPAVVLASLIAVSRIYVGVHYPTDVLGGIAVALISSFLGCKLVELVVKKKGRI